MSMTKQGWLLVLFFGLVTNLWATTPVTNPSTSSVASSVASSITSLVSNPVTSPLVPMTGNRVLVVAPKEALAEAQHLSAVVSSLLPLDIHVSTNQAYAPGIDERFYDGFIYLGSRYEKPPKTGLLADMAATTKPVLWIGYHAWLLEKPALLANGIHIYDQHSDIYNLIVTYVTAALPATDTTRVEAPNKRVLSWLYDASRLQPIPGAVQVDHFTYLAYFPALIPTAADFGAFQTALVATFGRQPPAAKPQPSFDQRVAAARTDPYWGGVHLPIYVSHSHGQVVGYDADQLHANLLRIVDAGGEWLTISQIYYQDGITASQIYADPLLTPRFASIQNLVQDAQKLGLRVRLSPITNISEASRAANQWRGMIRPAQLSSWWSSYREMMITAAKFARDNHIEALNIGAELTAMQQDQAQWRALIETVRSEVGYTGLIGYQVNFDQHSRASLAWADALDYLGIAAYWPIAGDRDPDPQELKNSWQVIGEQLTHWLADQTIKRLEFGELGYVNQPYTSVYPYSWKPHRGGRPGPEEQLNCYEALEWFLARYPQVSGIHIFASTEEDMIPDSIGYSPFGKPAEAAVRRILTTH